MQYDEIAKGDELYIYSKSTGYMKAWAGEDKPHRGGGGGTGVLQGQHQLQVSSRRLRHDHQPQHIRCVPCG